MIRLKTWGILWDFGGQPYGFYLRRAAQPWGPWPEGRLAFNGEEKPGWYQAGLFHSFPVDPVQHLPHGD